jgi:hypothetical protein
VKFLVLFLLTALSCTKKVQFDTKGVTPSLKDVRWEISNLNEGTWAVGSILRDIVSKNLTLVLSLPVLEEDDLEAIEKNYAVDSWLVKVIHKTKLGQRHHLATILAPFRSRMQTNFSANQTKSIAFSLTYAAWATSERFRKFQCPAFSHRFRLKDFSVEDSETLMEFNISSIGKFPESYTVTELVPPKITIAQSMVGDFYLEAALFNSKTKTLYSSFQQLPTHLVVREEKVVSVSGCEGIKQEYQH